MKRLFLCALWAATLTAQSISITNPSSGAALSGYTGNEFQVSLTSAPSVVRVCYTVDAYSAYNPGIDAPTTLGCSITSPFSYPYNSFWNLNGPHQLVATAYNALGAVVATSAAISFSIANTWPVSCNPALSVTTGTGLGSNWAGSVNVTATITGACAGDAGTAYFFIDGITQGSPSLSSSTATWPMDTTQFPDGPHNVCVATTDTTHASHYTDISAPTVSAATEWCRTVNFLQSAGTPAQAITSAHDIYLAPASTYTLTAKILNTDGTTTSTSPVFLSSNTAVATVGQSSGVITGVAKGNANIYAMVPTLNGTHLTSDGAFTVYDSSGSQLSATNIGELLYISAGSGFTPGVYQIQSVTISGGIGYATLATSPGSSGTGGTFSTGPTRTDWVYVWPTNTMPCIGPNGARYSSYNSSCFIMTSLFFGYTLLTGDQPYNPGAIADFSRSGINTFETSCPWTNVTGTESSGGQSAWQNSQNSYVAGIEATFSGYPKLGLYCAGDNFTRSGQYLWGSTNGPAGQWTLPPLELTMQSWNSYGNMRGVAMQDEVNSSWGGYPLQGPVTYGATSQSWLSQIVASGGTCTATTGPAGIQMNAARKFIIHGSSVSGMNSAFNTNYQASTGVGTSFTFACPGVANNTYNASNDAGLVLEPFAAAANPAQTSSWGSSSASPPYGFISNDAFAQLRSQFISSSVTFGLEWPNAGQTSCTSIGNWNGNGTQSIGSVSQLGDLADIYSATSSTPFLVSRFSLNGILASGNQGGVLRSRYGCFDPTKVMIGETEGTETGGYGIGYGPTPAVSTASGNTINFSSSTFITNVVPGITRLFITGATTSGTDSLNNNFYVLSAPTSTSVMVALAATDFTGSATGGTMLFSDGNTAALNSISASGSNSCGNSYGGGTLCGDLLTVPSTTNILSRERGRTFTISGFAGTANFGTRTFVLLAENIATQPSPSTTFYYREIPVLSGSGGTATIIIDNNYVKGRNVSQEGVGTTGDVNPPFMFEAAIECMFLRCAGERVYLSAPAFDGWSSGTGFTASAFGPLNAIFADVTSTENQGNQLFLNQHFENSAVVPIYHANNFAALIWQRLAKYWLQPRINSPDYGPYIDCGAAQGTPGAVLGCLDVTDGPETVTFLLSAYETSGQSIIRYVVNDHSISALTIIAAGTPTDVLTLQPGDAVFYVFPVISSTELQQPVISARLADVATASEIVVQWTYDPYYLGVAGNSYNCGSGTCTPPWDPSIGTLYFRLVYLGPSSAVLATSDVQMF
jgi:Bacterial Ig-like domain (group 2)